MILSTINSLLGKKGSMIRKNGVIEFCSADKQTYIDNEQEIVNTIKDFVENFSIDFLNEIKVYRGRHLNIHIHQVNVGAFTYINQKIDRDSIGVSGTIHVNGMKQNFTIYYKVSRFADKQMRIRTVGLPNRNIENENVKQLLKEQKVLLKALKRETKKVVNA
ncbi:hypothetical protein [Bacillus sp. NPDC094106]|uniref:hypothetical protein n=1 Tax=Bacillus sp. NPDC094106 TaxID=3363949 RepID=UPI003824E04B